MKIIIGGDHRGFALKQEIISRITAVSWIDVGCSSEERCDYPLYAHEAVRLISEGVAAFAVLMCGSGIGMAITANRYKGIYAGVCWTPEIARIAYAHDSVNVLVLSADNVSVEENLAIVHAMIESWQRNTFRGGRYQERLEMIDR